MAAVVLQRETIARLCNQIAVVVDLKQRAPVANDDDGSGDDEDDGGDVEAMRRKRLRQWGRLSPLVLSFGFPPSTARTR